MIPSGWVDSIFVKLSLTYGREFLDRYAGMPISDVKANWAHELRGFSDRPDAIKYAIAHLPPTEAPTALVFRDMCRKYVRETGALYLPPPEGDREEAKKALAILMARMKSGELFKRV